MRIIENGAQRLALQNNFGYERQNNVAVIALELVSLKQTRKVKLPKQPAQIHRRVKVAQGFSSKMTLQVKQR